MDLVSDDMDIGDNIWGPFFIPANFTETLYINVSVDPTTSGNITRCDHSHVEES